MITLVKTKKDLRDSIRDQLISSKITEPPKVKGREFIALVSKKEINENGFVFEYMADMAISLIEGVFGGSLVTCLLTNIREQKKDFEYTFFVFLNADICPPILDDGMRVSKTRLKTGCPI